MSVALLLVVACNREIPVQKQSVVTPPSPFERPKPAFSYYEGTHAADAIAQVRAKVGEPFRVLNIHINEDMIRMQVQDPKKPENVDQYTIDEGKMRDPAPVRLFGDTDPSTLEANVFDPADVDLTKIASLIREGDEKIQLEGREMSSLSIERNMFDEKRPIMIDVNYRGTRKNGFLRADRRGGHSEVTIH